VFATDSSTSTSLHLHRAGNPSAAFAIVSASSPSEGPQFDELIGRSRSAVTLLDRDDPERPQRIRRELRIRAGDDDDEREHQPILRKPVAVRLELAEVCLDARRDHLRPRPSRFDDGRHSGRDRS
jgi:hypothetical protein